MLWCSFVTSDNVDYLIIEDLKIIASWYNPNITNLTKQQLINIIFNGELELLLCPPYNSRGGDKVAQFINNLKINKN